MPAHLGVRADYSLTVLNRTGEVTTATGQVPRVLGDDNRYHNLNLVMQAYVRVGLHHEVMH